MRIRTIKPEFWTNEHLARLDDFTLLLAIGLLNYADDEGYFNANPALIRAALFPLRESYGSIPVAITHLSNVGFVKLYRGNDDRVYGHIVNFAKHQVINKRSQSKLKVLCVAEQGVLELSGSDTVALPSGTGNRDQGTGNKEHDIAPAAPRPERKRDVLFDSLAIAEGSDPKQLTAPAAKKIGVALAQIKAASPDVGPSEIQARARSYRRLYPTAALTATALASHWAKLGKPVEQAKQTVAEPEGWMSFLNSEFPDSRFSKCQPNEAHFWSDLDFDTQKWLVAKMREKGLL